MCLMSKTVEVFTCWWNTERIIRIEVAGSALTVVFNFVTAGTDVMIRN